MDCKVNTSMKFSLKKQVVLRGLTLILIIIIVSACAQAAPPNPTQVSGSGTVSISFFDMQPGQGIDYQALANVFHQQNTSIMVNVIKQDHPAPLQDADIAKQADVVFLTGSNPSTLPGMLPLQPLMEQATDFNLNDLWPGSLTACADAQGNPYGIPLTLFLKGVYYDPQVFDQAGIAYPQPGWTWEQFRQTIAQVSGTNDSGNTRYGFVDGPQGWVLQLLLEKQLLTKDGKLDPQAVAASLDWYVQLAKDQKLSPVPHPDQQGGWSGEVLSQPVRSGQAAMWVNSVQSETANPLVHGGKYAPYPVDAADDHTTPVSAACGVISAGSQNPQAAWAWLAFLSQQDLTGGADSGLLPAITSLAETSPFCSGLSAEQRSAMTYGLEHAWYYPPGLGSLPFTVMQAVANAISSRADLEAALQQIAETSDSTRPTPTVEAAVVNTPQPTTAPEIETIRFLASDSLGDTAAWLSTLQTLITDFEKNHPNILINYVPGPSGPLEYNLRYRAQNYDCFTAFRPDTNQEPFPQNDLLDLSPLVASMPALRDDLNPAFLDPFEKSGQLYGLPASVDITFIAYNADLLSQLGLNYPDENWTFDEMLTLAAQAANPDAQQPVYGLVASFEYLLNAAGTQWYDQSVSPPQGLFNTQEVVKGLDWINQLYLNGTVLPPYGPTLPDRLKPANYPDYTQAIANGQVAMWTTAGISIYNQNLPFTVGYVPLPGLSSEFSMGDLAMIQGYYISSHTQNPQACWEWIQYLADQPAVFGGYNPRLSVLAKEPVTEDPDRFAAVQAAIKAYVNNSTLVNLKNDPLMWPYRDIWLYAIRSVLQSKDIAIVLADAQQKADGYLTCISQIDLNGMDLQQQRKQMNSCYQPVDNVQP